MIYKFVFRRPVYLAVLFSLLSLVFLQGCDNTEDDALFGPSIGFVSTTDFSVGNLSTLTTTEPRSATPDILSPTGIHSDSLLRTFGNRVFIIQRLGANSVIVLDPNNPGVPLENYSTNDPGVHAPQSNPHDMAFVSLSKAYISRYSLNTLLIVNPLTGVQLGTIDLEVFADDDDYVEMDAMVIVNGFLYVALQRLDQNNFFSATNESYIAVIDTITDTIVDVDPGTAGTQAIVLDGRNPFGMSYLADTDRIYLANAGTFSTGDDFGGIEAVDPNFNQSEGIIITDNTLGGPMGLFAIDSDTVGYATVFDASFDNFVVPFDLTGPTVAAPLVGIGQGFIPGMAFDSNGFLYISDRSVTNPGIQVFDTLTNGKVEGPIDTGLPPNDIVIIGP